MLAAEPSLRAAGDGAPRAIDGPHRLVLRRLAPGEIAAGQTARLDARPDPEWSLDRVWRLLYRDRLDRAALAAFAALPELPERWRNMAEARLASGRTEAWTRRLETPL